VACNIITLDRAWLVCKRKVDDFLDPKPATSSAEEANKYQFRTIQLMVSFR
jgi:hypothetical protein